MHAWAALDARRRDARSVAGIPGASVEHNKFCVSVHFRKSEAEQHPKT